MPSRTLSPTGGPKPWAGRWRHRTSTTSDGAPAPRILFQRVPEAKAGKNRVHLDVRPDTDDLAAFRGSLVRRGATVLHEGRQGPHTWVTFADPEGNEFGA